MIIMKSAFRYGN